MRWVLCEELPMRDGAREVDGYKEVLSMLEGDYRVVSQYICEHCFATVSESYPNPLLRHLDTTRDEEDQEIQETFVRKAHTLWHLKNRHLPSLGVLADLL